MKNVWIKEGIAKLWLISFRRFSLSFATPSKHYFFLLLVFGILNVSITLSAAEEPILVDSFEEGHLYQIGSLRILELSGSYRDMGRQYGALTKDRLIRFCNTNEDLADTCNGMLRNLLDDLLDKTWTLYSDRQREILIGMAEEAGLCTKQVMAIDQNLAISFFVRNGFGCSYLSAWGDYTEDGKLITGRNFDWNPMYGRLKKDVVVVIFKPNDGSLATAVVVFNGMISALTGMNENGVSLSLNNGMNTFGPVIYHNRPPYLNVLHEFLWDSPSLDSLHEKFTQTRAQFPNIVNAADEHNSYSYETSPYESIRRSGRSPGFLVATNHMQHHNWGVIPLPCSTESSRRCHNLSVLGESAKGNLNVSAFQEILDQPLSYEDGSKGPGATEVWLIPPNPDITIYQVISTPETREMWIKIPFLFEWTHIDLKPFFAK